MTEVSHEDAEYMLTTFTNTGRVPEAERGKDAPAWERASIGAEVLRAYDELAAAM